MSLVRILVVNDSSNGQALCDLLDECPNVQSKTAGNNVAALEKCRSTQYDVILYDMSLSMIGDHAVPKQIKHLQPNALMCATSVNSAFLQDLPDCFSLKTTTADLREAGGSVVNGLAQKLEQYGIVIQT